jgi:GMP synthase-like glutamine amidotransferase
VSGDQARQNIHQMHRDHVPSVPAPFHLLGSTAVAPNQGMVLLRDGASPDAPAPTDIRVLTVQGHPEFTAGISDLLVDARAATGVLSGEIAEDAHRRNAGLRNDGVDFGRLMWKVLAA